MIEIALANLVASENAEIVGMNWQIELGSGNTLYGFLNQGFSIVQLFPMGKQAMK